MPEAAPLVRLAASGVDASSPPFGARLPQFIAAPADAAVRLGAVSAAIIGCGAVGRRTALHLTRLGIRRLVLVDPKSYKAESLVTQPVVPSEVGRAKARTTARLCRRINPALEIFYFVGPIEALPAADLPELSFGVVATDNLPAELATGQLFNQLGRPLFHASVHGATLTAQVRCFGNESSAGPCPACQFGEEEWRLFHDGMQFSCEGALASGPSAGAVVTPPTMAPACLCSLAADLCVTLALRHTLGLGAPVVDTWHSFNGYSMQTRVARLARNPACPCMHSQLLRLAAPRPLTDCTLRDLSVVAVPEAVDFAVQVAGHAWLEAAACACSAPPRIRRFRSDRAPIRGTCPKCGEPRRTTPVYSHREVSSLRLGPALDVPLRRLGVRAPRWVQFRAGHRLAVFASPEAIHVNFP